MKKIIISLAMSLFVLRAAASVFVAPSNEVVFLTVPTNQTMLISSVKVGDFGNGNGFSANWLIIQNGVTNTLSLLNGIGNTTASIGPFGINGPCQMAFVDTQWDTNNNAYYISVPVVISYDLFTNSLLHSVVVPPGSTNGIQVPAGKSVRFLAHTYGGINADAFSFQNGPNTISGVTVNNGDEFTGPLTITKGLPEYVFNSQLISYYFTDDFFAMPDTGYISGPTGSFEIAVEKSVDMSAWSPVVVYNTGSDQKAFYRLRLNK